MVLYLWEINIIIVINITSKFISKCFLHLLVYNIEITCGGKVAEENDRPHFPHFRSSKNQVQIYPHSGLMDGAYWRSQAGINQMKISRSFFRVKAPSDLAANPLVLLAHFFFIFFQQLKAVLW